MATEIRIRWGCMTFLAAMLGFVAGCISGWITHDHGRLMSDSSLVEYIPLPHHVPSHRGGAAFRFAMAHDVIHERYPKHGPAYYQERNRLTREKLAKLAPDDPATFPLYDDLGAGLHRLYRSEEAITVLRSKLARQQAMNYAGRVLYTSYANLGTFLVQANYDAAAAGDVKARERFREGVGLIRRAVELNPGAHFGREQWQAAIPEFLLAALEKPELLKKFDCLGNRLDLDIAEMRKRASNEEYGRHEIYWHFKPENPPSLVRFGRSLDDPELWSLELHTMRRFITKVGAENDWKTLTVPSHLSPVPFDEPMLGIIDMWRQGGGASPHLALAIGETMLRVGQRVHCLDSLRTGLAHG